MVDGVLEAVIGLVSSQEELEGAVALPYSFDKLEIFGTLPASCVSYVKKRESANTGGDQEFDVVLADGQGRVLLKFTRFVLKVFHQGRQQSTEEMSFAYEWKENGTSLPQQHTIQGDVLVFTGQPELYKEFAKAKSRADQGQLTIVGAGAEYHQDRETHYRINPERPADYARLIRELKSRGCTLETIVYEQPEVTAASTGAAAARAYLHQLYLAQALMAGQENRHTRVIQLCKGGEKEAVLPELGALRGFNKTLKLEHSKLHFSTLFTGQASTEELYRMVAAEVRSADDEVLYQQGRRYVHALKEIALPEKEAARDILRPQGVYLITGGLGKLGLIVAEHLAGQVQAKLVLIGRSVLQPEQEQQIIRLQKLGAEVLYVQADISQEQAVAAAVAEARSRFGSLHGIIHAAGVTRDALIQVKDAEQAGEVLGAKVQGLIYLDQATQEDKLDFIAAFSSIAAVTGNTGQSDYAYANAFMDEYMLSRHALVRSGHRYGKSISINWPLWKEGGCR